MERSWLTRLHVEGFRSLANVDFAPGNITLLIGPNGSGKSNLLQFLQLVGKLRTRSLGRFVGEAGGASNLLRYGPKHTQRIAIDLQFETTDWGTSRYRAVLGFAVSDQLYFEEEVVGWRGTGKQVFVEEHLGNGHNESNLKDAAALQPGGVAAHLNKCIKELGFFHFHDTSANSPLRGSSRVEDAVALHPDGANLASLLFALRHSEDEDDQASWRHISALLRQVAPFVKELDPRPAAKGSPVVREGGAPSQPIRLHWIDDRDAMFGPEHMSDGTLRVLALITALAQPPSRAPKFVAIDEPELGLHPAALSLFVDLVRSASGHAQILLSTQSSDLLDRFRPEEVVVVERKDGASDFRRLDPSALATWLADYALAQLYDKNVLGGRP